MNKEFTEDPRWALVSFHRQSGGHHLFGSDLQHQTVVSLRITPCEVARDLNQQWYHGKAKPLIEVVLSDMQFAELLTTMNVGSGVPCTVRQHPEHGYLKYEAPPANERDKINKELEQQCVAAMSYLDAVVDEINATPMSGKAKTSLTKAVEMARRQISGHLPFIETQYKEAMDRLEREAKAAVDGFITQAVNATGLETLRNLRGIADRQVLQIEGEEE